MTITVDAVYENGILRPAQPIPLEEGAGVRVTVTTAELAQEATFKPGRFRWERTPAVHDSYAGSVAEELLR